MMPQHDLVIKHTEISDKELRKQIKKNVIVFAGNSELKIFGRLNCSSGKRIKKQNRVFFRSAVEAVKRGFRPCGYCMRSEYKKWKNDFI